MSDFDPKSSRSAFRAGSERLRLRLEALGHPVGAQHALEAASAFCGARDWNTMSASLASPAAGAPRRPEADSGPGSPPGAGRPLPEGWADDLRRVSREVCAATAVIAGPPGTGKSLLLNAASAAFLVRENDAAAPGPLRCIGLAGVASGLIEFARTHAPRAVTPRCQVVALRLDPEHALNPFDIAPGHTAPQERDRCGLVRLLEALVSRPGAEDAEAEAMRHESHRVFERVVDEIYALFAPGGERERARQAGQVPAVDRALRAAGLGGAESWWDCARALREAGAAEAAREAERMAVPTFAEFFEHWMGSPHAPPAWCAPASRRMHAALVEHPLLAGATRLDLRGHARGGIVAADLSAVAVATGSNLWLRQTAWLLARRHAGVDWHMATPACGERRIRPGRVAYDDLGAFAGTDGNGRWHGGYGCEPISDQVGEDLEAAALEGGELAAVWEHDPGLARGALQNAGSLVVALRRAMPREKTYKDAERAYFGSSGNEDNLDAEILFALLPALPFERASAFWHLAQAPGGDGPCFVCASADPTGAKPRTVLHELDLCAGLRWSLATHETDRALRQAAVQGIGHERAIAALAHLYPEGTCTGSREASRFEHGFLFKRHALARVLEEDEKRRALAAVKRSRGSSGLRDEPETDADPLSPRR